MDKHNNLQQKKEKLLFCSMAIAALGLVGASPSIVSATTTAPVQSQDTEQNQNDGQPIVTDWNGLKISYNQKSHEVTIPTGTITNPKPLCIANGIDRNEIKSIKFEGKLTINGSAYALFSDLPKLEKIDFSNVDTSNVKDMWNLFANCSSLKEVTGITDTSNVTNMTGMFSDCSSLTNVDLSHFDTKHVGVMMSMFAKCSSLKELDLSNFDASNVVEMSYMFFEDKSLTSLDISPFHVANREGVDPSLSTTNMLKGLDSLTKFTFSENDNFSLTGFNTKGMWQEVGTGTVENPAGTEKLSASQLVAKYPTSKEQKTVTYVKAVKKHQDVSPTAPSTPVAIAPSTNNTIGTNSSAVSVSPEPTQKPIYHTVMHNTYVYDQNGALKNGEYFAGQSVATYGTKIIDGKKYYALGDNSFVKANNISGVKRRLTHNAYLYNAKGKRANRKVLKKHKSVVTYGGSVKIHGKRFYIVGKNRYVKKANF